MGLGYAAFDGVAWSSPQWAVQEAVIDGGLFADGGPAVLAWWTEDASHTLPFKASELDLGISATDLPVFELPSNQIQSVQLVENRHLAFGDSITLGAYPDPATGVSVGPYPERLEAMLDAQVVDSEVINDGVSGERTTWGRWRLLEGDWSLYEPQFLELMEGTNDITGDKDIVETAERLDEMVKWPQRGGTHVLLSTLLLAWRPSPRRRFW
ncbi:MAG: SGNH/GDSL hydrolase family protein, partial [Anaerolineae bacterium]